MDVKYPEMSRGAQVNGAVWVFGAKARSPEPRGGAAVMGQRPRLPRSRLCDKSCYGLSVRFGSSPACVKELTGGLSRPVVPLLLSGPYSLEPLQKEPLI
jgi:hypothetical protein